MICCIRGAVVLLMCALVVGCGSGGSQEPAYKVSGTVTVDGKPMADGELYFKTPKTGDFQLVQVKDGRFEGEAKAGDRRVEIYAYRTEKKALMPGGPEETIKINTIPNQYNSDSKLTATVKPEGPNQFQFELSSK